MSPFGSANDNCRLLLLLLLLLVPKKLAMAMAMAAATAVFLSFRQQKDCRPKWSVISGVQADIVIVVVLDVVVNFVSRVCQQENDYDYSRKKQTN